MATWVIRKGKLIEKQFAEPLIQTFGSAPAVIGDNMPETRHMANGRYYTSKAAFRQATKEAGCIEYGNETETLMQPRKPVKLDRKKRVDDIKKAIHTLRNRRRK